jgi:tRNA(Ile)-lysidine synthase
LHIANINADLLEFPLVLRPWKTGDYLYPFGMLKKKKVSRVLIDMKISQPQKEKTWVLESNQKIVWIVGLKMDNRFRVMDKTKSILQCVLVK